MSMFIDLLLLALLTAFVICASTLLVTMAAVLIKLAIDLWKC